MKGKIQTDHLYQKIAELLHTARQSAVRTINHAMVCTYFEIGRMIVEDEQQGKERADYGKQVLKTLSERLKKEFGKGFSVQHLENMRKFYLLYQPGEKSVFTLSWTHYLMLIRMEDASERSFYEIDVALPYFGN